MVIIKDGIRYLPYIYQNEKELQTFVFENIENIFGRDSILFAPSVIGSEPRKRGIPDAFVIDVSNREWFIIEIELSKHSLYDHIVPQVMKFSQSHRDITTRKKLKKSFKAEIERDYRKREIIKRNNIKEVYEFLSDIIDSNPRVAIVIDDISNEIKDVCDSLPFDTIVRTFKTYQREGVSESVPIFEFDPISEVISKKITTIIKKEVEKKTVQKRRKRKGIIRTLMLFGKIYEFNASKEIVVCIANELIKKNLLTNDMIPWGLGKRRHLISKTPIHPSGKKFFAPIRLNNGWWIETHASEDRNIYLAGLLLEKVGRSSKDLLVD